MRAQSTPAIPVRRHGVPGARRSQVRAAPCARPAANFGKPDQIVDQNRGRTEQINDPRALVGRRLQLAKARRRTGSGSRAGSSIPMIGWSTATISAASVTGVAPCLRRPLVPSARGSSGEPGTAKTSRPCSSASRAVISEPERFARLDDDDAERQPGNQAIAARESRARAAPIRTAFR